MGDVPKVIYLTRASIEAVLKNGYTTYALLTTNPASTKFWTKIQLIEEKTKEEVNGEHDQISGENIGK